MVVDGELLARRREGDGGGRRGGLVWQTPAFPKGYVDVVGLAEGINYCSHVYCPVSKLELKECDF